MTIQTVIVADDRAGELRQHALIPVLHLVHGADCGDAREIAILPSSVARIETIEVNVRNLARSVKH